MTICKQLEPEIQKSQFREILNDKKSLFETINNEFSQMNAFLIEMENTQVERNGQLRKKLGMEG